MITQVSITSLVSLAIGYLAQLAQKWLMTTYLNSFLIENLLTILIALLAINSASTGIVLTKIRELVEAHGNGDSFTPTRDHMVMAVKEQAALIALGIIVLTLQDSPIIATNEDVTTLLGSIIVGIFVYGLYILYDTSVSVMQIIDFKAES